MKKNIYFKLILAGIFILFVLLLYKAPFSERTLISNMEPYPDVLHYVSPARNFVRGLGFKLVSDYGSLRPVVSPLYSIILIPFYYINTDARMYYFANVLLALISLLLFYKILKKEINDSWIMTISMGLYVTNYYMYWYTSWAMAENLTITLFLAGIYLLMLKPSRINIILAASVSAGFYGTKYAYAPLTSTFVLLYFVKLIINKIQNKYKELIIFTIVFGVMFGLTLIYGYYVQNIDPLQGIIGKFFLVDKHKADVYSSSPWFSLLYFYQNFATYFGAIKGGSIRFLWDYSPFYPTWVFILGALGLVLSMLNKKSRFLAVSIVVMNLSQIFFISTFYSVDGRYIFQVIPSILLGLALFFNYLKSLFSKKYHLFLVYIPIFLSVLMYISQNFERVKKQISLNLRYAETPWTYISVTKLNSYFRQEGDVKSYVITPLPPFYVDYFSNHNYLVLPLSSQQDFRQNREVIWGPGDYSDLIGLYEDKLDSGNKVYLSIYGMGNEAYLKDAFNTIKENFVTIEVYKDCYDLCNLYEITRR